MNHPLPIQASRAVGTMEVTGTGDSTEAGTTMTPEDELKKRVFYASVRETIVRTWLLYELEVS